MEEKNRFQPYFHKETIDRCARDIKELFDLNFGKDWRIFMNLFYSKKFGKHWLNYTNVSEIERTKFKNTNLAGIVRDAIFTCCVNIMKKYWADGLEATMESINEGKHRFKWTFKKGEPQQEIISSELYNASKLSVNPKKDLPKPKELFEHETVSGPEGGTIKELTQVLESKSLL